VQILFEGGFDGYDAVLPDLSTVSLTLPSIYVRCNVVVRYLPAFLEAMIGIHVTCVTVPRVCFLFVPFLSPVHRS
jgi:hypothetical protein